MRFFRNFLLICLFFFGTAPAFAQMVDVNHADAKAIAAATKGIGMKKANAIVAYRKQHGPFKSLKDLTMVKGIGMKTVEKNRQNLSVGKEIDAKK